MGLHSKTSLPMRLQSLGEDHYRHILLALGAGATVLNYRGEALQRL